MTNDWPTVPLKGLLKRVKRREVVEPHKRYELLGAHWYAKGLYTKDVKPGMQIRAKYIYRVEQGDFVYNRLFGWKGSFAVATQENDGCYVSNEFPCFIVDQDRLDRYYLWYYFSRASAWSKALGLSHGATPTSRNRLKEAALLSMEIPLPPLAEQRCIVARIEELASKVEAAQALRGQAAEETEKLTRTVSSAVFESIEGESKPIGEVIAFRSDLIRPNDGSSGEIRFVGLQHIESHTGRKIGEDLLRAEQLTGRKFRFSPGEIVYGYLRPYLNKVWIADCEGICSVDQYVIQSNPELVDTKYQTHFMRSGSFLRQAIELTHNLMLPRLRTALLKSIPVPLPPLSKQRRIVAYLDDLQAKVSEVQALQSATAAQLDALLPSILDKAFKGEL